MPSRSPHFRPPAMDQLDALSHHTLAPFWRRLLAYLVDITFVVILCGLMDVAKHWDEFQTGDVKLSINPFHGWSIAIVVLYFGLLTFWGRGRTPGKRLFGIRVQSVTHSHLSLWHSLERALGYGASALEGGFGFTQYFIHPNRQTVHDRIAETIVVLDRRAS